LYPIKITLTQAIASLLPSLLPPQQQQQQQNVIAPTIAPVPSSSGQILAVINNPPNCPMAKPEFGDACDWGQRCQYYVYGADGAATGAVNCDCNGDCVFQCRKALNPGFQAF
jgi:hypothetical protein